MIDQHTDIKVETERENLAYTHSDPGISHQWIYYKEIIMSMCLAKNIFITVQKWETNYIDKLWVSNCLSTPNLPF